MASNTPLLPPTHPACLKKWTVMLHTAAYPHILLYSGCFWDVAEQDIAALHPFSPQRNVFGMGFNGALDPCVLYVISIEQ